MPPQAISRDLIAGKWTMTWFRLHHDDGVRGPAREKRISLGKVFMHIGAIHGKLYRAVANARLRSLMLRCDYSEMFPPDQDGSKFPQRPMVLGDKWDF
jgi:hypothetical protein